MGKAAAVALAGAAVMLAAAPASSTGAKRASCYGHPNWKTIRANAKVRVFYARLR